MSQQLPPKEPWMPSVGHAAMGFQEEQKRLPRKRDWLLLIPFAVILAVVKFDTPLLNWGYGLLWALWLGYTSGAIWLWQRFGDLSIQNTRPEIKLKLSLLLITAVCSTALLVVNVVGGDWQWTNSQVNAVIYPLLALWWLISFVRGLRQSQGP
ncbi:hypothetical protein [Deinococcus sp.]|uniref:hypothetical protein n=1 Tax=Deinococcus sp. TaxID=47478 RepID=UPI003B5C82C1